MAKRRGKEEHKRITDARTVVLPAVTTRENVPTQAEHGRGVARVASHTTQGTPSGSGTLGSDLS